MAQSGFTPIQLYRSTTAAAVPLAANLAAGELALNLVDEKLYFENNAGVVKVLADSTYIGTVTSVNASGGTTGMTFSGGPITGSGTLTLSGTLAAANGGTGQSSYVVGDILFASTTTALSKLADVATGNALISGGVGVAPLYGKIGLTTHVSGTLPVANGGTGQTTYTNGELLIGNTTGNTLAKATLTPGTNISITNGAGTITINATDQFVGTVTSVAGTGTVSGLTLTGTVTSSGSLTLGGTLAVIPSNFASQTANTFLSAPNGSAGVPTFRAIVAADIPTLNQNTTGTAANVTGTVAVANGGTGTTTAFTDGSVVFAGASGVYSQDNASLFWDDTNNRLGVGTATPAVKLEVSSAAGSATPTPTEIRISTTTNASDYSMVSPWGRLSFYSVDTSDSGPKVQAAIDAISDTTAGGRMSMVFSSVVTGGTLTERMRINSGGIVAIGTASPDGTALLDVSSTTKGFLPPRMTTAQRDLISSPPNGLMLYNSTTDKLQVRAAGAWVDLH